MRSVRSRSFFALLLWASLAIGLGACADQPTSPVAANSGGLNSRPSPIAKQQALRYQGQDRRGRLCELFVAPAKNEPKASLLLQAKFFSADGHEAHPLTASWAEYNSNTGSYREVSNEKAASPWQVVLLAIELRDPTQSIELEKIPDYLRNNMVAEMLSLQVRPTKDTSYFFATVDRIMQTGEMSPEDPLQVDIWASLQAVSLHHDHYHYPQCQSLQFVELIQHDFNSVEHAGIL